MLSWHFLPRHPKARRRDPVQSELFHDDDLRGVAQAVVRESIQNSLDARASSTAPVRVKIYVSGAAGALAPAKASIYFNSLMPHLKSAHPKSVSDLERMVSLPCPFFTIEDFGTTGLTGDPTRANLPPIGVPDNFFYFFRAEGASGKGDGKRGRWGIGKHTFFSSSRIQTFIGLTIRDQTENPGPLVMGQSISKVHPNPADPSHELEPDGWMAIDDPNIWLPHNDIAITSAVATDWKLSRTNEPGLSVVVPYCEENITFDELLLSVLYEYAAPILQGSLEVQFNSGSDETEELTSASIVGVLGRLVAVDAKHGALQSLVQRMSRMTSIAVSDVITIPRIQANPSWTREVLSEETRDKFNESLEANQFAVIRVPVSIKMKDQPLRAIDSHFDVGFFADPESRRAVFIREGIRITGVGSKSAPFTGLQPIVLVPTGILGSLLGDAEGPAHLAWDPRRQTFVGRYEHGAAWIDFVKQAPRRLIEFTRGMDRERDYDIGSGWFPDPDDSKKKKKGKRKSITPRPKPPPAIRMVLLSKVKGGFSARLNSDHPEFLQVDSVKLVMAYDRRTGNPFSRWSPADFTISELTISSAGCSVQRDLTLASKNQIVFKVNPKKFKVSITGFDTNRDVIARAEYA